MADGRSDKVRRLELGRQRRAKTRAKVIAAAFELFGEEDGLYVRIEDVAQRAGITRATFYDHFSGMSELRDAVTYEVTHDFLTAVTYRVSLLDDPRERVAAAIRFYLHRVRDVPGWGRSMLNLSANGIIFGAETYRQAELTVVEAMAAGQLSIDESAVGRDAILGTTIAAIATMLREEKSTDYPEKVAGVILVGLGVEPQSAVEIARRKLPDLAVPPAPAD
ncbi:TetR/AcrR family transcriptional regulator [Novosphingobium sp. SL115]|uniref:TetR/AcrR family transcriptional regulator n=1 Tax=Novosphingobium sp. SL115 TaxID=2995150 RepID=UPI002275C93D|nr:TetR/AcrR family transcriptional regulator [Novosphingobium sp. SL115]MCY1671366.1 TetR/AcrR family transcriptional regulator [Novosphingobium sp. SL115]